MVVFANAVFSQINTMRIYKNDGSVVSIPLNEIDSITHYIPPPPPPSIDGYTYQTVILGNGQEWFAENLRTAKYANGDAIPNINGAVSTSGGWSWYNNDSTYENPYGKLYNWYAAHDIRNVCPAGWHVPTNEEWTLLTNFLGGESVAGTKLKSTSGWYNGGNGTNESGLNFRPSGFFLFGGFPFGDAGCWWSSSVSSSYAWFRNLYYGSGSINKGYYSKDVGFAIRCLRD